MADQIDKIVREKVLVVVEPDYLEVYGQKFLDVHIATRPFMNSTEGRLLAERWVELNLPRRHRHLFWPDLLRASDVIQKIRPSDLAYAEWRREMLATIDRVGRMLDGSVVDVVNLLKNSGIGFVESLAVMVEWNERNAKPPWTLRELVHKVQDCYRDC